MPKLSGFFGFAEVADLTFWQNGGCPKKGKGLPFSAKKEPAPRKSDAGSAVVFALAFGIEPINFRLGVRHQAGQFPALAFGPCGHSF